MIDPNTVPIQGDISRADARVLIELCRDKIVVEVGMGGSTLILAQCAAALTSYDTTQLWYDRTKCRLAKLEHKTCEPVLIWSPDVPDHIDECDVLFVDGIVEHRAAWVARHFTSAQVTICHDSRGTIDGHSTAGHMICEALLLPTVIARLHSIDLHYHDSNMLVMCRRYEPAEYVNWNLVETEGRVDPHNDDE